jgi:uncharacterized membrane protein
LPLPESIPKQRLARYILAQEIRGLLLSPALWLMFIIVSLLTGYSFFLAVELFSQASRTALSFPELARGMNPLDGIFVPTFGAYYLSQTLLLPFVAIRLIGQDKQSGALKLLLQLPLSPLELCGLKLTAIGLVLLVSLIPAISVLVLWHSMGGHIHGPEIAVLFAGHALYALTVVTLGMFVAVITDSLPTAAMVCLSVTLGSWVLDFAAGGQGGVLDALRGLSLSAKLHQFENGLLATTYAAPFLFLGALFFLLASIWLHPGKKLSLKVGLSFALGVVLCFVLAGAMHIPGCLDVTENQRHSFNPADSRALQKMNKELILTIHLNPGDSRLLDMEKGILAKLHRTVAQLNIQYVQDTSTGLFGATENDEYGLIQYEYDGRRDQSYSNSQEEVLAIIYGLAGVRIIPEEIPAYQGYPLVTAATKGKWWFYIFLPLLFLCGALYSRKGKW